MHRPCGQANGFGITATTATPEAVFAGFLIRIDLILDSSSALAPGWTDAKAERISWFFGTRGSPYFEHTSNVTRRRYFRPAVDVIARASAREGAPPSPSPPRILRRRADAICSHPRRIAIAPVSDPSADAASIMTSL